VDRNRNIARGLGSNTYAHVTITSYIKRLFEPYQIFFDTKEAPRELNGVKIEAFPSHYHLEDSVWVAYDMRNTH
jgi:hypothetical protein